MDMVLVTGCLTKFNKAMCLMSFCHSFLKTPCKTPSTDMTLFKVNTENNNNFKKHAHTQLNTVRSNFSLGK